MTVEEQERRVLQEVLVDTLGPKPADTLMHYLPPVGWADVATKHDLEVLEERIGLRLSAELAGVRAEFNAGLTEVRTKVGTGLAEVRTEVGTGLAEVRAELNAGLAEVRTELYRGLNQQTWKMISMFAGLQGLLFAALKLF